MICTVLEAFLVVLFNSINTCLIAFLAMRELTFVLVVAVSFTSALVQAMFIMLISFVDAFLIVRLAMMELLFVLMFAMIFTRWFISSVTVLGTLSKGIISCQHTVSIAITSDKIFHVLLIANIVTLVDFFLS